MNASTAAAVAPTLTPGQLAARKAVETRRARLALVVKKQDALRQEDAQVTGSIKGGFLLHVAGVVWSFGTRAALDRYIARQQFNVTADVQ
jgi:hypothetical protein